MHFNLQKLSSPPKFPYFIRTNLWSYVLPHFSFKSGRKWLVLILFFNKKILYPLCDKYLSHVTNLYFSYKNEVVILSCKKSLQWHRNLNCKNSIFVSNQNPRERTLFFLTFVDDIVWKISLNQIIAKS